MREASEMPTSQLRSVLGSRRFRQLLTVRLTGQFCDGLFQAALATFVLFSPERQATAPAIAGAFAILYLPYSLVGPFAGVFLDKWSRRQVLLLGNLARAAIVVAVCLLTARGHAGLGLGITVLIALGINRFILAGLSASLPHTVKPSALVTGNALAPTAGTIMSAVGALAGVALGSALGGGDRGSVIVLMVVSVGYAGSGLLAMRMPRTLLGPHGNEPGDSVGAVLQGLADGAATLWRARPAWRGVSVVALHRIAFGATTVLVILLLRNTLNLPDQPNDALADLTLVLAGTALGALIGAATTPTATRHLGSAGWSAIVLLFAAIATPVGLSVATVASLVVGGFVLGFAGQAVKVCGDTLVQQRIHDDHRGRVFALYDVMVNLGLVVGISAVAFTYPASGQSTVDLVVMAVLLLGASAWMAAHHARNSAAATSGETGPRSRRRSNRNL